MLKVGLFLILVFSCFFSSAQNLQFVPDSCLTHQDSTALHRPDSVKLVQKDTTFRDSVTVEPGRLVSVLSSATGHIRTYKGHWASAQNRIPYENPDYNNPYYEKYELGSENFCQFRIHEISVDSHSYYALIIQYKKGYYKKPEFEDGWTYFKSADYYIFEKQYLKRLLPDTMKMGRPYYASLPIRYSGNLPAGNINNMLKKIDHDLNVNLYNFKYYDTTVHAFYQFVLKPVQGKNGRFMRFNTRLSYANTGKLPAENDFSGFRSQYYELPMEEFRKFVRGK